MPINRLEPHPISKSWTASDTISLELSPKPYTITRLAVICRLTMTTHGETALNDYYDRWITRLSLTGKGRTFFDFSNMRAAYHLTRFIGTPMRRPSVYGDSKTTAVCQFGYLFHFGVAPQKVNPITGLLEDNPWDLTAGIPPMESGNLNLGGSFAAAGGTIGTNDTCTAGQVDIYLYGVQPQSGDPPASYLPRAFPAWAMRTPTPTATSSAFATQDNIPAGDFLHSILVMALNGTNLPRSDTMLNSLQVYNQLESRSILTYGGQTGVVADVKVAEMLAQDSLPRRGFESDNISDQTDAAASGTVGVPTILKQSDAGLYWLPLSQFANKGHPLYGVDLRRVATGDLQLRYGISDATGTELDMVYRRYSLNPDHPANMGA